MDRVGFKAIDFTTSTHMGVAVRYKREDPWERIRLTAAATPNTPLQFMSTGFRFISWETASPEFMALAFEVLARSEEHTSELQSQSNLVCRLLLEKKKKQTRDLTNDVIDLVTVLRPGVASHSRIHCRDFVCWNDAQSVERVCLFRVIAHSRGLAME